MINKLSIQNFQSHKFTELEFSPGVNVITGTSDSGKTAIIRALRWLVWNKPTGDSFRSNWGGDTYVYASMYYGKTYETWISRYKGEKGNTYDLQGAIFEGFGTDVPNEVQEVLGLNEINLQQQLDSPFLLSDSYTPGNVALHFNKVANIGKINSTQQNIEKRVRETKADIKYEKGQLKKYEQELSEFPDLQKLEIELEVLEELEQQRNQVSNAKSRLSEIINSLDSVDERIEQESKWLVVEKDVDNLLKKIDERNKLEDDSNRLGELMDDIEMINHKTEKYTKIIRAEKIVIGILNKIENRRILTADKRVLDGQVYRLSGLDKTLRKTQENVLQLEQQFAKEFPDICPLCGTPKKISNYNKQ
jgi:DNA repair protein SbcC/Rad50